MTDHLIPPHGGSLVDLVADPKEAAALKAQSAADDWPSWDLTPRQLCDTELLLCGAFSPLQTFLGQADYESVRDHMRLADGTLWPVPVALDLPEDMASGLVGGPLALRDPEGVIIAVLYVDEVYRPDLAAEASAVFGTTDPEHPGAAHLTGRTNPCYVSGRLVGLTLPLHYDYRSLRHTPAELRAELGRRGWRRVVAFQSRTPMHRAHQEMTRRAAQQAEASLLIHPVVGLTAPGDIDHYTRARCYQEVLPTYPPSMAALSFLNLAMRMAGPREALWHAIIRKNYGCTHFIVGSDHAGPTNRAGQPFYGPYDAQELLAEHEAELGVTMVPFRNMVYVEDLDAYVPDDEAPAGARVVSLSEPELRRRLAEGREIPAWFTFPAVMKELRRSYPPRSRQGFTVFFTGFSGSGKSTIANVLLVKLLEMGGRPTTMLDGDVVRKHLSSELTFSKEHRDINIRRIGFVASEITKNGGIAICAPIAPYDRTRKDVRAMVEAGGGFVLVHVATSIEECEARDRKGFYAKARAGIIKEFTGISDPYEVPEDAEIVIDTGALSASEAAHEIVLYLEREGYIGPPRTDTQTDL